MMEEELTAKEWRTWLLFVFTDNSRKLQQMSDEELKDYICAKWDKLERD